MAYGLRVNFHKSKNLGFNHDPRFLEVASDFFGLSNHSSPFQYLGVLIRINPRRCSSWDPIVEKLCSRLSIWKGKFVLFEGCVVCFNIILNSISLNVFSFYRAPKIVIQDIIKIEWDFMWKGKNIKEGLIRSHGHLFVSQRSKED